MVQARILRPQVAARIAALALTLILAACGREACAGLIFRFAPQSGMSQQAIDGFAAAGALWSSLITDDIAVNISVAFAPLGSGILGQASTARSNYSYDSVRSALVSDATSSGDSTAVANLPLGSGVGLLINRTANNPNGPGSATPYLDNNGDSNNTAIRLTNANAKALGLLDPQVLTLDATITFNSEFGFDFEPGDGIDAGSYDFVGIAAHEIGHALGFVSGVDALDLFSPPNGGPFDDNQLPYVSSLDLFRYSTQSAELGAIDWTLDEREKYFSIDGGLSAAGGATFALGRNGGDGSQASHWKDGLGLGIMDPTAAAGERLVITANDLLAFDVIGYNLASNPAPPSNNGPSVAAPEPSTLLAAVAGLLIPLAARCRRRGAA